MHDGDAIATAALNRHAVASMVCRGRVSFNTLAHVFFLVSIVHGSCALDTTFSFSPYVFCYCLLLGSFALYQDSQWASEMIPRQKWSPGFTVDLLSYFLSCAMWIFMVAALFRQRRRLERVIKQLQEIDTLLDFPKYRAAFYFIPFGCAILANIAEKVIVALNNDSFMVGFVYYLYVTPIVTFSSQYFFLTAVAGDQFSKLNDQLKSTRRYWMLENLAGTHKGLCDTVKTINGIFNIHLLITTSLPFLINTMKIYSSIMCVIQPDTYDNNWLLSENLSYLTMSIIVLWFTARSSSMVKRKARQFNIELLDILLNNNNIGDTSSLQQYLYMKWEVKPTACGFYDIDFPLLTSMATGYLTFVTYLLQLSGASLKS